MLLESPLVVLLCSKNYKLLFTPVVGTQRQVPVKFWFELQDDRQIKIDLIITYFNFLGFGPLSN